MRSSRSTPASLASRSPALGRRTTLALVAATAMLALAPMAPAEAAPRADLWKRWTAHQPNATATIDHSVWDRLLKKHAIVRGGRANLLRYASFTAADRAALAAYIATLEMTPISRYSRREQLAYWLNLYNALTVKVVLDRYPVQKHPRHRHFAWAVRRWPMGQEAPDDRRTGGVAR